MPTIFDGPRVSSWTLAPRTVHIWRGDLDAPPVETGWMENEFLSADERTRAHAIRGRTERNRFIASRGILRWLLAGYVGVSPGAIDFVYTAGGKPCLANPGAGIHFNVAHADSIALFAFSRDGEIGVDVERIRRTPRIAGGAQPDPVISLRDWTARQAESKRCGGNPAGPARGGESFDVAVQNGYVACVSASEKPLMVLNRRLDILADRRRAA